MVLQTRHWDRLGNGGLTFTELGFGAAPLGNLYKAISDNDARATLDAAWEGGVRYFDTAPLYGLGLSETRLNPFLRDKPRDEYILSSKVGRLIENGLTCRNVVRILTTPMTASCVRLNIHFHALA
jgi:D-threo-aldose 1-dehydrogenase